MTAPSLCPLCRAMIVLHGTGDPGDPVMFPEHGDCLDRDTPAATVIEAMRATGARSVAEVTDDPAMTAAALATIRGGQR